MTAAIKKQGPPVPLGIQHIIVYAYEVLPPMQIPCILNAGIMGAYINGWHEQFQFNISNPTARSKNITQFIKKKGLLVYRTTQYKNMWLLIVQREYWMQSIVIYMDRGYIHWHFDSRNYEFRQTYKRG